MQEKYNHKEIEQKWQKIWEENKVAKIGKDDTKNKYYILDMFPYPSGDGLHMGHTESYTASDVYYRFKKMQGYNVLHPQGFDAFGLPAENFAIKTGIHPAEITQKNIDTYIKQMKSLGLNYDFDEKIITSDPKYYKWTQWIFEQFYKNDLVYQSTQKANWCSSCQTVIANEQVVSGECERCGTEIELKEIPGWFFKITDFADELIEGLDKVDWPEHTKKNQKNWIGKSEGAKIKFKVTTDNQQFVTKEDVLILHGWGDDSEGGFIPETKKYLENLGHKVFAFNQPNTNEPKFDEWFNFVENKIKENGLENFSIIGHSMGGHLALKLAEKYKLNKLVLVSPVGFTPSDKYFNQFGKDLDEEEINIFKNYQNRKLDVGLVKDNIQNIEFIFGKSDSWITKEIRDFYINNFSDVAKIQVLENKGHLTEDEGVKKIPELENIFDQKTNVIMIHGCPGNEEKAMNPKTRTYDKHWFPWIKNELEKKDLIVDFPLMPNPWCPIYEEYKKEFEKLDINENSILVGTSCGASFLVRWLGETDRKINKLILVAPWKEDNHEEKEKSDFYNFTVDEDIKNNVKEITIFTSDNEKEIGKKTVKLFSEKLNGKIIEIKGYGHYLEKHMGTNEFPELLNEILKTKNYKPKIEIEVFTTRPDTLFGATYMVLAPEHSLVTELKDQITNWDEVEKYIEQAKSKTERERIENKEKTGVRLEGVFAVNPANKEEIPIFIADYVLADYGTGAIMAVPAHDERDFKFANKYKIEILPVIFPKKNVGDEDIIKLGNNLRENLDEYKKYIEKNGIFVGDGYLINSGKFDGNDSLKAKQKITEFVGGEMTSTYRLRDWSISRQRYWGCPIPIVYSPEGEAKLVPEEHLPWTLPTDVDFNPTGVSPLSESKELKERVEKIFGKGWTPEYDTMDTFVDSSWYFLRYPDVQNEKEFCSEKRKKWLPVDLYIGGAEHTYMHLLFARFFVKVMNKIGLIDFDEPFPRLRHQGMVLDKHGKKMSKSKGNVVNPDDMVERFGADSVRTYMLFTAPLEDEVIWNEDNIVGVYRFLEKVWRIKLKVESGKLKVEKSKIQNLLHKTIKKVSDDIEDLRYNTAISSMMILVNQMEKEEIVDKNDYEMLLKLLSPFAPHITQELWEQLGNESLIQDEKWPEFDENLVKDDTHTIVLQVNGKVRSKIEIVNGISEDEVKKQVFENEVIKKWVGNSEPKKIIYIENKLINVVV